MKLREYILGHSLLKEHSIQKKMVVYFLLLILPSLAILGVSSYWSARNAIKDNVSKYAEDMLKQSSNNIDLYFQEADNITASIIFDETIREDMYNSQIGEYECARAKTEVDNLLSGMIYPREYALQLYIIDIYGTLFSTNPSIDLNRVKQQQWYQDIVSGKAKKLIVPSHDSRTYTMGQEVNKPIGEVVTLLREYKDIERNKLLGTIAIDIDYKVIERNFQNLNVEKDKGEILIATKSGAIVYCKDGNQIGNQLDPELLACVTASGDGSYIYSLNGESMLVVFITSGITGWKTIERIPIQYLMYNASKVKYDTVIIMVLCILFSMTLSFLFSHSITKPIMKLIKKMKHIEKGDFDISMNVTSNDEVGKLATSFNQMVKEIKRLIARIYDQENEKRLVELQMLQQQINPHFIYNTLDSINWMARMQNASNISSAITALIRLLRMSIHNGNEFNTIRDELECLKNYITVQKFRYGDLNIQFEVEEEILDQNILKMLLQPLVENALFHGIDLVREKGVIKISARRIENVIEISVEDNGKGMTKEEIDKILSSVPQRNYSFTGIGISNIIQRIKLYYGEKYGLTYESEQGKGLKAILVIPADYDGGRRTYA